MSDIKDKLQSFIDHFHSLSQKGEDADDGFNAEFMVRCCILLCVMTYSTLYID